MKHTLNADSVSTENLKYEIYILELDTDTINIGIEKTDYMNNHLCNEICLNLNKKELHSFIGTLLHVQAKMKGGKNG